MISTEKRAAISLKIWESFRKSIDSGEFKDLAVLKKMKAEEAYYQNKYAELQAQLHDGSPMEVLEGGVLVLGT